MQRLSVLTAALIAAGVTPSLLAAPRPVQLADPGVINHERIEYWMTKRGEIDDVSTREQIDAKLRKFTSGAFNSDTRVKGVSLAPIAARPLSKSTGLKAVALPHYAQDSGKSVKVLGILVDFPDLPHDDNRLTVADTDMYYPSYTAAHYDKLLFSSNGFPGPTGQTLQSARQFYTEESGGSFDFGGKVFDWVRADHNAAYYGGPVGEDNDGPVGDLVFEAISKLVARGDVNLAEFDQEDQYDIDGDGNVDEPDGIIDHIMVFHSSIGEEAGGGYLGKDAIWSHRYFVFDDRRLPKQIPDSSYRVFGYTIQPIDAAAGVCTHEFGHDLGLPDEYDTDYSEHGSPVGLWSLMSGGSWTGNPAGSQPSSMSAWARDYLQNRYGGNWINNQALELDQLSSTPSSHTLVSAVNHIGTNQLTLPLPPKLESFHAPYSGKLQYYSGAGHDLRHSAQVTLTLPAGRPTLTMKAHWQIEQEYDYLQVLVNGAPLSGSYATAINTVYANLGAHYTGNSADLADAEGDAGWVTLSFDLGDYAGQEITLSMRYVTDESAGGYGFVADDLAISNGDTPVWQSSAETAQAMTLDGFARITDQLPGAGHGYFIQLRQFVNNDAGLAVSPYDPGVLVWYYNRAYSDNNVGPHPGYGFTGVVDADQILIPDQGTQIQIKDAAFSRFAQKSVYNDPSLEPVSLFDDALDYSAPGQPQSGLVLPKMGLKMAVTEQADDSATATVALSYSGTAFALTELTHATDALSLTAQATAENGQGSPSYTWETGDGKVYHTAAISHTYPADGTYTLTLTVIDEAGQMLESSRQVEVREQAIEPLSGRINASINGNSVSFSADVSGGLAPYGYQWHFGDDSSASDASGASVSHTYASAGTYQVQLTMTDAAKQSQTITRSITIADNSGSGSTGGSSSGGGGSLGWFTLMLLPLLGRRLRR
ncbi:immune inhibitor A domain-containing protein [Ferrimonas sediminicola]|nr:immune inhibitor A domain-containing protein [Ferrimonas sediminicola]